MSSTHPTPIDSEEAYQALMDLILADEPSTQDGLTWDRIALSFTASSPNQRHINYLVEAASHQLLGQTTDTICRMFMYDSDNIAALTTGAFRAYVDAIAALPQRVVDLRALRGAEFCEGVRRMIEERLAVRDVVPPWDVIDARRQDRLERERRELMEGANVLCDEWSREM
jgi:hypothetical protein